MNKLGQKEGETRECVRPYDDWDEVDNLGKGI
jgi:hypothetical protein